MWLLNVTDLDLDKEIERDFNVCCDRYMDDNAHDRSLKSTLRILQEYIPAKYSTKFKSPCWYDFQQIPTSPLIQSSGCAFRVPNNRSLTQQILEEAKHSSKRHLFCLPAFFIPGFPKCASTTLHGMIVKHPLVTQGKCKEGKFWTRVDTRETPRNTDFDKRLRILQYFDKFSQLIQTIQSNPLALTLDASITYAFSNDRMFCALPILLMRVLPEAKYILIMRNPSERYFSHYWFFTAKHLEEYKTEPLQYAHSRKALEDFHNYTVSAITKFRSCVDRQNSTFKCIFTPVSDGLRYSLYYYHIAPWLKIIPRERFLFLRTEDLAQDTSLTMSKVWHFLNIPDITVTSLHENVNTVIKEISILPYTKILLDEFFRPYNQLLADLLSNMKYLWND